MSDSLNFSFNNSLVPRRTCSYCKRKRTAQKMVAIEYPLLRKTALHCKECYAKFASQDTVHIERKISLVPPRGMYPRGYLDVTFTDINTQKGLSNGQK